jgi:hypothetical protein
MDMSSIFNAAIYLTFFSLGCFWLLGLLPSAAYANAPHLSGSTPLPILSCPEGFDLVETWTGEVERMGQSDSEPSLSVAFEKARGFAEENLVQSVVTLFNRCDSLPGNQEFKFNHEKRVEPPLAREACQLSIDGASWGCSVWVATSVICCAER